ncbi:uncharacterized protein DS421_3g78070 [Arachis hypogaea]|nr:uncharacterized protein DS421_3g78070 [Arachis hypogaea]
MSDDGRSTSVSKGWRRQRYKSRGISLGIWSFLLQVKLGLLFILLLCYVYIYRLFSIYVLRLILPEALVEK